MREMKDSGIEWIGEIPADWEVIALKHIAHSNSEVLNENTDPDYEFDYIDIGSVIYGKGVTEFQHMNFASSPSRARRVVKADDVIISTVRTYLRAVAIIREKNSPQIVSTGFLALRSKNGIIHPTYLYYAVLSDNFIQNVESQSVGISYPAINSTTISTIKLPIAPYKEQQRIADYLDRKCSQIDAIIARQQEVIEKLKAYKLSVITEAVTKGLNPDVPMKDSGVEWIGEIPEHWDFRRIKNCCLIVDCKNRTPDPDPDGEYIVVRTTCIRDGSFSYEGSYHTNAENFKEWTAKGQPQHGDIFFTREAPMGEACLVPDDDNLCMGQRVMFFRPLDGSDPRYILYSIYGPLAREYIDSKNKGSTVGHLKLGQVASLPLFYCPPKGQNEIADYLDKRCGAIDKVVEKKAEIISKLTDYKKSLIYEVVTGKKEV